MNWEEIDSDHGTRLYRSKLPGGWLVKLAKVETYKDYANPNEPREREEALSIAFVSDPKYAWDLKTAKSPTAA